MRKSFGLTVNLSIVLALFFVAASAHADTKTVNLMAGQNTVVGTVTVSDDGTDLTVKYLITAPGWVITETHAHVAINEADIPQTKKGNPKVGKFEKGNEHDPPVTEHTYTFFGLGCTDVVVAAHAVVAGPCDIGSLPALGLTADVEVLARFPFAFFAPSAFNVTIEGNTYPAWCIEPGLPAPVGVYEGQVALGFDPDLANLLGCLLNNYHVGDSFGDFTISTWHIQYLIWQLIAGAQGVGAPEPGEDHQKEIDAILQDLGRTCEGFVPDCGGVIPVIVEVVGGGAGDNNWDGEAEAIEFPDIQKVIILVPVCCETAWGAGTKFKNDRGWAMYFDYKSDCNTAPSKSNNFPSFWGKIKSE